MCGICGKISFNSQNSIDAGLIRRMAGVLRHRGPDDEGVYLYATQGAGPKITIGLGHRRLSIIDLSQAGHQPMSNEDSTVWVILNGEIYNFQELKTDLVGKGHKFSSSSDTEVIIHLYEESGIDCVRQLRGMFAFALWDSKKQKLFLARDRVGKKPLNYAIKNGTLIFASEIKSILQDPDIDKEVNIRALDLYLTYQYIPAPETIFCGIHKLPPAHILVWEKGIVKIENYWNLSYQNKIKLDEQGYSERFLELFTEATKIRLISDVPLGAFLSGGIDSSAVVAIMSELSGKQVKTFSIGFKEDSFNELGYARKVAKLFDTDHQEYIVESDCLEVLPKLIWHFNEPFADSSAIPAYYLSKMTRQAVTVALNGDGGDESFAGYERYLANRIAGIYGLIPSVIRKSIIAPLAGNLPESTRKKDPLKRIKRFVGAGSLTKEKRYAYWMSIFDAQAKNRLYSQEFKNRLHRFDTGEYLYDYYKRTDARDFTDATMFVDVMTYLPGDLLVKIDIATMANSLEARSPFLDHKLMEFAAALPSGLKLKGITTKYILKKALAKILPNEILQRKKAGFGVPVGAWFRGDLKKYAYELLLARESLARGYFQPEMIKALLDAHVSGASDHGARIWSLVNLELWHRMFIDQTITQ